MNVKRIALWLIVIMVISFIIAGVTLGELIFSYDSWQKGNVLTYNEEKVFILENIKDITISTSSTNVDVIPSEDNVFKIELVAHYLSPENAPELKASENNGVIDIEVDHKPVVGINVVMDEKLTIYVPTTYRENLSVSVISGNVNLSGLQLSDLSLNNSSGNIKTKDVTSSNAVVKSISGKINLIDFAGDLKGNNTSGNTWVKYKEYKENIVNFTVISGDIGIDLPDNASFALDANSVSGDVKCSFPIKVQGSLGKGIKGEVNGGGRKIILNNTSGDIEIK